MATSSFAHSVHTPTSLAEAWAALQLPSTWETIDGVDEVAGPQFDGHLLVGFRFFAVVVGRRFPGRAVVQERAEPRAMTLSIDTSEMSGVVSVMLDPFDRVTRVTVSMTVSPKSLTARLAFPVLAATIEAGFPRTVERFAGRLAQSAD